MASNFGCSSHSNRCFEVLLLEFHMRLCNKSEAPAGMSRVACHTVSLRDERLTHESIVISGILSPRFSCSFVSSGRSALSTDPCIEACSLVAVVRMRMSTRNWYHAPLPDEHSLCSSATRCMRCTETTCPYRVPRSTARPAQTPPWCRARRCAPWRSAALASQGMGPLEPAALLQQVVQRRRGTPE